MDPATRWKLVPFVVLVPTVVFAAWRVHISLDDPHFSVPADYYEQGRDWDAERQRRAASADLGWQARLAPGTVEGGGGVELRLLDPAGAPVTGASGTLRAFQNAYPADVQEFAWTEAAPGVYRAPVALGRTGVWRWQVHLKRGEEAWQADLREEVYTR